MITPVSLSEGLFRAVRRDNASLARIGLNREVVEPALAVVQTYGPADLESRTDADVATAILAEFWHPPVLRELRRRGRRRGHDHVDRSRLGSAGGIPLRQSTRVPLEWKVEGNAGWLRWWPDDTSLVPIDQTYPGPSTDDERDRTEWNRLVELQSNLFRLVGSTVTSFVEIPIELEGTIDPAVLIQEAITARDELIRGFAAAIGTTAARCRDDVEALVTSAVAARRTELAWYGAVDESLALIPEVIELYEAPASDPPTEDGRAKRLEVLPELSEGSFDAIVQQILRWRDRVEMYPDSFGAITEDACSDVLAATLAMLFRVAEREVFVYGGKSDIYIPLAALHPDRADPRETFYFYAEAKKGTGAALARHALGQVERYRALRVRRAVMLFYVTAQDVVAAAKRTLTAFAEGWRAVSPGLTERVVHRFETTRDGLGRLEITVIFIHTPRLRSGRLERSRPDA